MLVADCDLRRGLHAKRCSTPSGHYSREDVLAREWPTSAGRSE